MAAVTDTERTAEQMPGGGVGRWLFDPVPAARIAAFRTLVYGFVVVDLLVVSRWVWWKSDVSTELYQPLLVGRLLPLPAPTPLLVDAIFWLLLAAATVAATGRWPRLLGWTVFALYFEWMVVAMSYGKVDHDRFAFLVALAVLPTVGRARHGDPELSQAGGWALRVTQLSVVATYFLASWAKLRFGGLGWLTGSTLTWAVVRRESWLSSALLSVPGLLVASQFAIVAFELLSPAVLFLHRHWRYAAVGFFFAFHVVTFACIGISFAPHLVALTAFLPLERLRPIRRFQQRRTVMRSSSRARAE
ncbi:MAG TPA: hypothetical protein VK393_10640 [Nocardioidaceae bacterium]|nr:hypothetical protein [Nocardioidaceae bacterium]